MSHIFFYDGFLINKAKYLSSTLMEQFELGENSPSFEKLHKIDNDYTLKDYQFALKTQIRFLCLQSIETLFELIFGVYPNFDPPSYNDKIIIERILASNNQKLVAFINNFQSAETLDELLDRIIENNYSVADHIFYFNLNSKFKYPPDLNKEESIKNIKYGLNMLAHEISDRDEYNAFKHGDRIFPYIKNIIIEHESLEEPLTLSSENSLTFFHKSHDDNTGYGIRVKQVNIQNDYGKILLTSKFVENIVSPRKYFFGSKAKFPDIHRFDNDILFKLLDWDNNRKNES